MNELFQAIKEAFQIRYPYEWDKYYSMLTSEHLHTFKKMIKGSQLSFKVLQEMAENVESHTVYEFADKKRMTDGLCSHIASMSETLPYNKLIIPFMFLIDPMTGLWWKGNIGMCPGDSHDELMKSILTRIDLTEKILAKFKEYEQ